MGTTCQQKQCTNEGGNNNGDNVGENVADKVEDGKCIPPGDAAHRNGTNNGSGGALDKQCRLQQRRTKEKRASIDDQ
jgi:hypothetical protein